MSTFLEDFETVASDIATVHGDSQAVTHNPHSGSSVTVDAIVGPETQERRIDARAGVRVQSFVRSVSIADGDLARSEVDTRSQITVDGKDYAVQSIGSLLAGRYEVELERVPMEERKSGGMFS